jgi:hypothetical protein
MPHEVEGAIDPVSTLLLAIDVGERTWGAPQCVIHQVVQVLAPDCVPLLLTKEIKEYAPVVLHHFGQRRQPPCQRAQAPTPKPNWVPTPQRLYAQFVKSYQRRRVVRVRHRGVFGTVAGVHRGLGATDWQIHIAFIERATLSIRQHVVAVGWRVITLCKGEDGLRQPLTMYHMYHHCCLPPTDLTSRYRSLYRPMGRAQRRTGGPIHRSWPQGWWIRSAP